MKIIDTIKGSIKANFVLMQKSLPSPSSIRKFANSSLAVLTNAIRDGKFLMRDAKKSYKSLYENNMNLAIFHLENGNTLDATLRYKIAHMFNKKTPEPLLGLADIALQKKQHTKAVKYFKRAIERMTNEEEKRQIQKILYEISA